MLFLFFECRTTRFASSALLKMMKMFLLNLLSGVNPQGRMRRICLFFVNAAPQAVVNRGLMHLLPFKFRFYLFTQQLKYKATV